MVLRCKRIHKPGQTFSFSYLSSKLNRHSHTEISAMTWMSYTEKGNQTILKFYLFFKSFRNVTLLGRQTFSFLFFFFFFFFFSFYNVLLPHLHAFQLSRPVYVVYHFIIDSLNSFFRFSEMFSEFRIYN